MPTPAETMADRDARLVKAEMQRDRAVELLREWLGIDSQDTLMMVTGATEKFMEGLK